MRFRLTRMRVNVSICVNVCQHAVETAIDYDTGSKSVTSSSSVNTGSKNASVNSALRALPLDTPPPDENQLLVLANGICVALAYSIDY